MNDADETVDRQDAGRRQPALVRYFGDYELLGELGHGGMGVVYKARQVSLNRTVALKMLKSDVLATEDELRRFQNEAEAVALLDHPNVVPILEVGIHEGRRYFSMKLVSGASLDKRLEDYAADPRAAARLVATAAQGVHHAHQRGILHRDLKPANILVDDQGEPHVTDFGLAKRVEGDSELTHSGAILGTPSYMAPEQASGLRGAVTTASDVYGLGAILYALLAGRAPFRGDSVIETLQQVRDQAPTPPSKLRTNVPRDLEIMALNCLEKQPSRRYASALALSDDLCRWLDGRPIAARRVGPLTRGWMWCKRKPVQAGLAAALLFALVAGVAGITVAWREAVHRGNLLAFAKKETDLERDLKAKEAAKAQAINRFLIDRVLVQADPSKNKVDDKLTVLKAFDDAASGVAGAFPGQPDVEADIRMAIGDTYFGLGAYEKARMQHDGAQNLLRGQIGNLAPATLNARAAYAQDLDRLARSKEAETILSELLVEMQREPGPEDPATLSTTKKLAETLISQGRFREAEELLRKLYATRIRISGPVDANTFAAATALATALSQQAKFPEAEGMLRAVVKARREVPGPEHPSTLGSTNNLADVLIAQRKFPEAERLLKEVTSMRRRVLGAEHPLTLSSRNQLAACCLLQFKFPSAEGELRGLVEDQRRASGPDHPETQEVVSSLAVVLYNQGKLREAEELSRSVLAALRRTLGHDHPETLQALSNLAFMIQAQDKLAQCAQASTGASRSPAPGIGP